MNNKADDLNRADVLLILDKYIKSLKSKDVENLFESKTLKVIISCIESIMADIMDLDGNITHNMLEVIHVIDEINKYYFTNLKLVSRHVIVAQHLFELDTDLEEYDICPECEYYIFEVDEILPILKEKLQ
jgi:hypothetical protein